MWTADSQSVVYPGRVNKAIGSRKGMAKFANDDVILKINGLSKRFGGLSALSNVNLAIGKGLVSSIIGPNGAGKTTLFNVISGILSPSAGRVEFCGKDITGIRSDQVCRMGIGRSFQGYNLFTNLSVFENVRIAAQSMGKHNFDFFRDSMKYQKPAQKADEVIEKIGLTDAKLCFPYELSHGDQRMLEVGIALAMEPLLLMLDEPTSGLAPEETNRMLGLIENIRKDHTIMLIEHKMMVVMSLSERIVVLHQGEVICEGTPDEVKADHQVRKAYLGGYQSAAFER
jgi:branched-chain amino acid transport system ATP-binding protein